MELTVDVGVQWRRAASALAVVAVLVMLMVGLASRPPAAVIGASTASSGGARSLAQLASGVRDPIAAAVGAADHAYWVRGLRATNPAQHLSMSFSARGAEIRGEGADVRLSLLGAGRVAPVARRNRIVYGGAGVQEWYVNGPLGLEQGFTIDHAPGGSGPVTLSQAVTGGRLSDTRDGTVLLGHDLRYDDLLVTDARGRSLPATLSVAGDRLRITIDATGARYPLRVDPTVQEAELSPPSGTGPAAFGSSIAVAGDTIAVGDPQYDASGDGDAIGAVFVFEEHGSSWANATPDAVLTASNGNAGAQLGYSVAISGNTIVSGAIGHSSSPAGGSVYVFVEPSGGWATGSQTAELDLSTGQAGDNVGESVGISGNTVVAGAPYFGTTEPGAGGGTGAGAVWVEPSTGWAGSLEQTAILTASDGALGDEMGMSVGISGDTVVAGAPDRTPTNGQTEQGAAYVLTEPTAGWANMTQTAELTDSSPGSYDHLGRAVAISGDTVLAGLPDHTDANGNSYTQQGAIDVFSLPSPGATENQSAQIVPPSGGVQGEGLGASVALAGGAVVAGVVSPYAPAPFYLFPSLAAGANEALDPSDFSSNDYISAGVAVDGATALVGGYNPYENTSPGNAYVYASGDTPSAPTVTSAAAAGVTASSATLDATINGGGADTNYVYAYGTSSALGSTFPAAGQFGAGSGTTAVLQHSQTLSGLLPGTTYDYEVCATNAVAATPVCSSMQSFTTSGTTPPPSEPITTTTTTATTSTAAAPNSTTTAPTSASTPTSTLVAGHASVSGTTVSVPVACEGATSCSVTVTLSVVETISGRHVALAAAAKKSKQPKRTKKTVVIGSKHVTVPAGQHTTIKVLLNATGVRLLKANHHLKAKLTGSLADKQVSSSTVTFVSKAR
jgi:hypothetical protein